MKSDEEIIAICESFEKNSLGGLAGELAEDRAEALDRYFGRPYGNEVEGRSQVVSKDLADTVNWIMPSLMRVFMASDDFVRFDPVGPEDEDAAEQESDYVNYVMMKENPGFTILYDWFKDALILKNGYVKRYWCDEEEVTHETYTWLSEEELVYLFQEIQSTGDEFEVVEQDQNDIEGIPVFDVKIKRTKKYGKVEIEPIPPEELLISNQCRGDLQESPFVQHTTFPMRSELIEMGLDPEFVASLPSYHEDYGEIQSLSRDTLSDEYEYSNNPDDSTQQIEFKENYVRIDLDGDGIAELRYIVIVGGQIPEGDEWNCEIDEIPISYLTPNRLPHRHIGLGLNDEIEDLSKIKTTLLRAGLDNTYQVVNSEYMVNERVFLEDFTVTRPNGIKRIKGKEPIGDAAVQLQKAPIVQHVLPVLDYIDTLSESRTGVGKNVVGLDPDTLASTTAGAARQALQQANAKIEMIARLFAETGVKDLALAIHALLIKHQDKQKVVKLRNKWVPVNPQEWKTRTDMTVNVGLGTGSQDEIRANLMMIADAQERAAAVGIVTPRNVYNLAEKLTDVLGWKEDNFFFTDPDNPQSRGQPQGQPQSNPLAEAEQVKGMFNQQDAQMKHQFDVALKQMQLDFEKYKFDKEMELAIAKAELDAMEKGVKAGIDQVDIGQPGLGAELKGQ